jgi:predicted nucleotidyltransferase
MTLNDKKASDIAVLKALFGPILDNSPAQTVYLFGSRARGDFAPESDVDLIIVADTRRPFVERCKDFFGLIGASPAPVEMLVYTPEEFRSMRERENPLVMKAIEEGKLLYERSVH